MTFDEKINARYTAGPQSQCWFWQGSLKEGRPSLNLRHVMRYIYEREVAPIPPGMTLYRTDHTVECRTRREQCVHLRCVNPWHVQLGPGRGGLYEREVNHDLESTERTTLRKRRVRGNRREKEAQDDSRQADQPVSKGVGADRDS
jgi:hypothetical protein